MEYELRPFWRNLFSFNWKFGLFLISLVCIPRFILVLNANTSGNYGSIGMIMFVSAVAPFIFLTKFGRKEIGLKKPEKYYWLLIAFVIGLVFSLLLYYLGQGLYGNSYENWYTYIGKSYKIPPHITPQAKNIMFVIMAVTGMTFSPVGEELFFRGIVHSSFARSIGESKASLVDSAAFALTHISHFGLVFISNQWSFFPMPAFIWVIAMFLVSLLFFVCKKYSWLLIAFVLGLVFSLLLYYLGQGLYGNSYENWYTYIGKSYKIPPDINLQDKRILFVIMAITGMTFSPVGEELFFRGIVHSSFARSIGESKASLVDSAAFALTHISHFGLVFISNQWSFLTVPAFIWVVAMFLASLLFFACKKYSGSIAGLIVCHAAFNLGMIYCIFYLL